MPEQLTIKLTLDETNTILSALGNLPYIQIHALIHNLQNQVGPQLVEMDQQTNVHANGKETKTSLS